MIKSTLRLAVAVGCLSLLVLVLFPKLTSVHAQTPTGYSGGPVTSAAFYRIAAGHQDEWLALYKKYHYPIMQYEIKQGLVKSETMYKRGVHELSPNWDFFVVIVYRDMDAEVAVEKERAQVMKTVFPDKADFDAGDRKRWELTTEHWDEKLVEVPLQ
jgi:expansin (peptidoglycan-binding protein)